MGSRRRIACCVWLLAACACNTDLPSASTSEDAAPHDSDAGADPLADGGSAPADAAPDSFAPDSGNDAPSGGEPTTFISKRGALLFADDFSTGSLAPSWSVIGGTWDVVNGKLVGSSAPTERDPNVGHMVATDRAIVQFTFSFTGSGQPGTRLNHKEVADPQHLLAVRIAPPKVTLTELSGWSTTTMATPLDNATAPLASGTVYTGVLEVLDRKVAFSIDGTLVVSGSTVDQSATPKNHLILAAYGATVSYDDVKVWAATPP